MYSFYKNFLKILLIAVCFSINLFAQIAAFKQVDTKTPPNAFFAILAKSPNVIVVGGEGEKLHFVNTNQYFQLRKTYIQNSINNIKYDASTGSFLVSENTYNNTVSNLYSTTFNGTANLIHSFDGPITSLELHGDFSYSTENKKLAIGMQQNIPEGKWIWSTYGGPDYEFPQPLNDIKVLIDGRGIMVGSNSMFSYSDNPSDNNGKWQSSSFMGVHFDADKIGAMNSSPPLGKVVQNEPIYVIGNEWQTYTGIVARSTDNGVTWDSVFAVPNVTLRAISVGSVSNAIIGGNKGVIYYTKDGGDTWAKGYDSTGYFYDIYDIANVSADSAYAVGSRGLVLLTTDGGESWTEIERDNSPGFGAIYFSSPSIGFAVGLNSGVYKTTDAGENWNEIYTDSSFSVSYRSSIFFIDDMTGFIAGSKIYKTTDGGMTWNDINTGVSAYNFRDVYFVNNNLGFATYSEFNTGDGAIKTTDGGITWDSLTFKNNKHDKKFIYFVDENLGFVSGTSTLYRTTDGGDSWDTLAVASGSTPGYFDELNSKVNFINSSTGFFGRKGYIFKTTDRGNSWTDAAIDNHTMPTQIQFLSDNIGYAVCATDTFGIPLHVFYKTTDGGNSWLDLTNQLPGNTGYTSLFFTDENTGFLAGSAGIIKTTTGGEIVTSVNHLENTSIPTGYKLYQNYPNPFNPTTKIRYSIPSSPLPFGKGLGVRLIVYDILGREVATLVNKQQRPGNYEVTFNASRLSSGVYFYQLKVDQIISIKKMILLK